MAVEIIKGNIVGYRGHRAVIFEVPDDGREDEARILYRETLPECQCPRCYGHKTIKVPVLGRQTCFQCDGTGRLPERRVLTDEWVPSDKLTRPPAEEEHPLAEVAGALFANPRAIFGEGAS